MRERKREGRRQRAGASCNLRLEARATGNWNVVGDELQSLHALWACGMWHVVAVAVAVAVTVAVAAPFV